MGIVSEPVVDQIDCFSHIPYILPLLPESLVTCTFDGLSIFLPSHAPLHSGQQVTGQAYLILVAPKSGKYKVVFGSEGRVQDLTVRVKQGVRCHPHHADPSIATIECIKDLNCTLWLESGNISFDLAFRGEKGNLRIPAEGVSLTAKFADSKIASFRCLLPMEDTRAARTFMPIDAAQLKVTAACTAEVGVGSVGELNFKVVQKVAGIPLKGSWKLLASAAPVFWSGNVAGMRMFMPNDTELKFEFIPISPGEIFLPGLEVELLPSGEFFRLESGPRIFAMPVALK